MVPIPSEQRKKLIDGLASRIVCLPRSRFLRVAVDGVDGAGKTTFADELADSLHSLGTSIIRASVDSFHNPRAIRYRLGKASPDGFYLDSYDHGALREQLLEPLGPTGNGRYRAEIFDHLGDKPVSTPLKEAAPGSVLLLDGIFLHRPELRGMWNFSCFLHVPFEISIPRGAARGEGFGSPDLSAASNKRYIEGQLRYLRECSPHKWATVSIDNSILDAPVIIENS